jgi:hypothetical protein
LSQVHKEAKEKEFLLPKELGFRKEKGGKIGKTKKEKAHREPKVEGGMKFPKERKVKKEKFSKEAKEKRGKKKKDGNAGREAWASLGSELKNELEMWENEPRIEKGTLRASSALELICE